MPAAPRWPPPGAVVSSAEAAASDGPESPDTEACQDVIATPESVLVDIPPREGPPGLLPIPKRELSADQAERAAALAVWRAGASEDPLIAIVDEAYHEGVPGQAIQASIGITDEELFHLRGCAGNEPTAVSPR